MSPADRGAYLLAIVCEADADRVIATCLADRVLNAEVDWIELDTLDQFRTWTGLGRGSTFLKWHAVKELAAERNIRVHGHFDGLPDAVAARKALILLGFHDPPPDAVVLVRDSDGELTRLDGLKQARDAARWPFPVVVGLAHTSGSAGSWPVSTLATPGSGSSSKSCGESSASIPESKPTSSPPARTTRGEAPSGSSRHWSRASPTGSLPAGQTLISALSGSAAEARGSPTT